MYKERLSPYGVFVLIAVAFGGFLFGYNTGVISGALVFLSPAFQLSTGQEGMVVSLILLGALFGALIAGVLADRIGRKKSLFLTSFLFIIGTILFAYATSYTHLLLGRFVSGIALGLVSVISPLYLGEVSPPHYRGRCVSFFQLMISLGILVAYIAAFIFSAEQVWRPLFFLGVIPSFLQLGSIFLIPETPAFSIAQGKFAEAAKTLSQLRLDKAWEENLAAKQKQVKEKVKLKDVLSKPVLYIFFIGMMVSMFQQITGINAIIYYTPKVFLEAGIDQNSGLFLATMSIGIINCLATLISVWLMDKKGRRRLLLVGVTGMMISLGVLSWAFLTNSIFIDRIAVASLMVFVFSFSISFGPVTWVLLSEIFPLKVRGIGVSISLVMNWLSNYALALAFPDLIAYYGGGIMFAVFSGISLIALLFVYALIPETKGKTLDEIESMVKAGKF